MMRPTAVGCPRLKCGGDLSISLDQDSGGVVFVICIECGVRNFDKITCTAPAKSGYYFTKQELEDIERQAQRNYWDHQKIMNDPATWED